MGRICLRLGSPPLHSQTLTRRTPRVRRRGTGWAYPRLSKLAPPLAVARTPAPTATQFEAELHETASTPPPLGIVRFVQVRPPSDEVITPGPTATQSRDVGHESTLEVKTATRVVRVRPGHSTIGGCHDKVDAGWLIETHSRGVRDGPARDAGETGHTVGEGRLGPCHSTVRRGEDGSIGHRCAIADRPAGYPRE